MEHEGSVAIVTGGASGIGAATCRILHREGARVAVADLDLPRAQALAAELGERAIAEPVDVTQLESARGMVARVRERFGPPTVLINNAGWDRLEPFLDNEPELWRKLVDVNLFGQIHCARAFLEQVKGGGRIVNLGSDAGRTGSSGEAVYSAAKGGVIALTKTLAREAARLGVAVNCVCPGLTDTPLLKSFKPSWIEAVTAAIPLRRAARPEEVAEVICFLASARASYVTGQILSVNGGLTMVG